jgi:hypothetical protein
MLLLGTIHFLWRRVRGAGEKRSLSCFFLYVIYVELYVEKPLAVRQLLPRRAFALPPPPRRRQAADDLALSRCRHRRCRRPVPPFVGWLLRCCPPSDFVVIAKKRFIVPHRNPNTRAQ